MSFSTCQNSLAEYRSCLLNEFDLDYSVFILMNVILMFYICIYSQPEMDLFTTLVILWSKLDQNLDFYFKISLLV